MSQVKLAQREYYLDNKLKELRSRQSRTSETKTSTNAVTSVSSKTSATRGLPTREAARRRNKKLLADLQVTEARLRSLACYGPANAILEAELSRLPKSNTNSKPT